MLAGRGVLDRKGISARKVQQGLPSRRGSGGSPSPRSSALLRGGTVHLLTAAVACALSVALSHCRFVALPLCRPKLVSPRARASVYLPRSASRNRFVCPLFIMKMQSHYAQLEYLSCCFCCCCCCCCCSC